MSNQMVKSNNRMVAGVCAGIAESKNMDTTMVRAGFFLLAWFSGIGIILYIILAFIMPNPE